MLQGPGAGAAMVRGRVRGLRMRGENGKGGEGREGVLWGPDACAAMLGNWVGR